MVQDILARAARQLYLSSITLSLFTQAEREQLHEIAAASQCRPGVLDPQAGRLLEAHSWPGNVRELQQVMERASILAEGSPHIRSEHLYFSTAGGAAMAGHELTAAGTV